MIALRHDDEKAINRYRCADCGKRWATGEDDVPEGFQDACPNCHAIEWPLRHGMSARTRFTVYWIVVFVLGWGFGLACGLAVDSVDGWWRPLW